MSKANDLETQAAAWLIRQDGGSLSAEEQAKFESWLTADPRNRAAYMRLEQAWRRADRLTWLKPLDGPVNEDLLASSPLSRIDEARMDERPARAATRDSDRDELSRPMADMPGAVETPSRRPVMK